MGILNIAIITTGLLTAFYTGHTQPKQQDSKNNGFAVVELFTSEGCSSCPPADELVARIQSESKGQSVYILAFHVDYWDRLGWKDAFSNAAYSARQRQYAGWLNLSSVYTPQIVVNGTQEFVGSAEGTLRNAVQSGLKKGTPVQLAVNHLEIDHSRLNFQYDTRAGQKNTSLVVAIVQRSATTKVKSGENGGHTLAHVQIVRKLQSEILELAGNGNVQVDLPQGLTGNDLELITFLQDRTGGQIKAACRSGLDNAKLSMIR